MPRWVTRCYLNWHLGATNLLGLLHKGNKVDSMVTSSTSYQPPTIFKWRRMKKVTENGKFKTNKNVESFWHWFQISLTSRRGHFVDKVRPNSKADEAGLKHGDLLLEVNGVMVRDFSHEDLVKLVELFVPITLVIRYSTVGRRYWPIELLPR